MAHDHVPTSETDRVVQTEFDCPTCDDVLDQHMDGVTAPRFVVDCPNCSFEEVWVAG